MNDSASTKRALAVAMMSIGILIELAAVWLLARGGEPAGGVAVLIPGLFLVLGGALLLMRPRE